jgi:pilus assembly protein CpaC
VKFDGFLIPALKTRRAKTGVELRDGQSFALAGLLDNSESKTLSKVPVLGDIPVLGSLFRSKSFQKNETELIFIVTAQLVKPVNRDDLPQMRGVDGLKNGSPLGLEPKTEEIQGRTGLSVTGQNTDGTPTATPGVAAPAKGAEPADNPKVKAGTETSAGSSSSTSTNTTRVNPTTPIARTMPMDVDPQPLKP